MDKMDLTKLVEALSQMQEMIDSIRSMLPEDATSAQEQEATIDDETAEKQADAEDDSQLKPSDDKALKKAAVMRLMAKEV